VDPGDASDDWYDQDASYDWYDQDAIEEGRL
jgi:hypothetical protein